MEISLAVRTIADVRILVVAGDVDLYSSPTLRTAILTIIRRHKPAMLIIDLGHVNYLDSSGIATLVEGLQLANASDVRFRLTGLSPSARQVLQLARLERVFAIYPTEADALTDA